MISTAPTVRELPPLSLYIHWPWCIRKCPYCDFNSHESKTDIPEDRYIDALISDLETDLPRVWGRRLTTIYLGGGTPSLMSAKAVTNLLSAVRARIPCLPNLEVTLEVNPGTADTDNLHGYRQAGVNRLSIGVQSFNDPQLAALGRIHSGNDADAAVRAAGGAGFDNINLDLMFGLPDQTSDQALKDLSLALSLDPAHISLYQLTVEPNTAFAFDPPPLPDDDAIWTMQQQLHARLVNSGFYQYEVSAFGREGRACKHNLNYWQFGDYLGIGAGAHAKITDANTNTVTRLWKHRQPKHYIDSAIDKQAIGGERLLTQDDLVFEFMLNALRLNDGFTSNLFQQHTGLPMSVAEDSITQAKTMGLLHSDTDAVSTTARGKQYLNDLIQLFLKTESS